MSVGLFPSFSFFAVDHHFENNMRKGCFKIWLKDGSIIFELKCSHRWVLAVVSDSETCVQNIEKSKVLNEIHQMSQI